jgi:hypothetical protein
VTRFADTAHHHATAPLENQRNGGQESLIEALNQCAHRVGLDHEHATRELERAFTVALAAARRRLRGCPHHARAV